MKKVASEPYVIPKNNLHKPITIKVSVAKSTFNPFGPAPNAFNNILKCLAKMGNTSEILWVILRSLSRDIGNVPV